MTTIDKIRAEIKRLKAENNCGTDEFIAAKDIAYDKVFDFLEILEEPVSDDLEEAAENPYVLNDVSHAAFEYERTRNDLDARSDNEVVRRAFIAGAEWQKEEFEKNRLAACDSLTKEEYDREMDFTTEFIEEHHRTPTFSDAIEYGMRLQREQMMEGATYNELMELYRAIRDELVKRHRDVPINIKEEQ